jgi:hypothetical protein
MKRTFRLWIGAVVLASGALVTSCAARTVNHVLADPGRYRNHEITLSGYVVDSFSVAQRGVYRIEDRTGTLWVVSDRGVPRRGARVKVRGVIREGFNLGGFGDRLPRNLASGLVLVERSHRADW